MGCGATTRRRRSRVIAMSGDRRGARRALVDTAPLIYWFEGNPLTVRFESFFESVTAGVCEALVTPVTLADLVIGPLAHQRDDVAERYANALTHAPWRLVPTDASIAMLAARLRVEHRLRLPDAIQLATAIATGCDALITHDRDFPDVPGLHIWR